MRKSDMTLRRSSREVCVLVCLRGRWQESTQIAERAKLAEHHTLQVCAHLRVVWHIVRSRKLAVGLFIILSCCAAILLSVAVRLRALSLIVADVLVEW
jgi:hypothetical protein